MIKYKYIVFIILLILVILTTLYYLYQNKYINLEFFSNNHEINNIYRLDKNIILKLINQN